MLGKKYFPNAKALKAKKNLLGIFSRFEKNETIVYEISESLINYDAWDKIARQRSRANNGSAPSEKTIRRARMIRTLDEVYFEVKQSKEKQASRPRLVRGLQL